MPSSRIELPMRAGTYGVIKQESPSWVNQPYHLTRKVWNNVGGGSAVAWAVFHSVGTFVIDTVLLPVYWGAALFDTPDSASLANVSHAPTPPYQLQDGGVGLRAHPSTRKLVWGTNGRLYKAKTWMTFSLLKGRDASLWDQDQQLKDAEARVQHLMRNSEKLSVDDARGAALAARLGAAQDGRDAGEARAAAEERAAPGPRVGIRLHRHRQPPPGPLLGEPTLRRGPPRERRSRTEPRPDTVRRTGDDSGEHRTGRRWSSPLRPPLRQASTPSTSASPMASSRAGAASP